MADRRAVRGALGVPGGNDAVHSLRGCGGGVRSAIDLLGRVLSRLGTQPLEIVGILRGGRGGGSPIWSRSSTARPPGFRPSDFWSRQCSGRGFGGCLARFCRTPLTLCLAVLGKYVSSLSFFATLLGEEAELDQNIRFYQRLVSLDQDGATAVVEAALERTPACRSVRSDAGPSALACRARRGEGRAGGERHGLHSAGHQ